MAKYRGSIGYSITTETAPGVWKKSYIEHKYSGEVLTNTKRSQAGEDLNDKLVINNRISVIADPFAYENFHKITYIEWMGSFWKVTSVEVQRPRLILTVGGVFSK